MLRLSIASRLASEQYAGVGRDLLGLAADVGFDRVDHRRQLMLVARMGVERHAATITCASASTAACAL